MSVVSGPQSDLRPLALVTRRARVPGPRNAYSTRNAWQRGGDVQKYTGTSKDDCFQPSPEVAYGRCGPSNDVVRARDILKCSAQPLVTLHGPG